MPQGSIVERIPITVEDSEERESSWDFTIAMLVAPEDKFNVTVKSSIYSLSSALHSETHGGSWQKHLISKSLLKENNFKIHITSFLYLSSFDGILV